MSPSYEVVTPVASKPKFHSAAAAAASAATGNTAADESKRSQSIDNNLQASDSSISWTPHELSSNSFPSFAVPVAVADDNAGIKKGSHRMGGWKSPLVVKMPSDEGSIEFTTPTTAPSSTTTFQQTPTTASYETTTTEKNHNSSSLWSRSQLHSSVQNFLLDLDDYIFAESSGSLGVALQNNNDVPGRKNSSRNEWVEHPLTAPTTFKERLQHKIRIKETKPETTKTQRQDEQKPMEKSIPSLPLWKNSSSSSSSSIKERNESDIQSKGEQDCTMRSTVSDSSTTAGDNFSPRQRSIDIPSITSHSDTISSRSRSRTLSPTNISTPSPMPTPGDNSIQSRRGQATNQAASTTPASTTSGGTMASLMTSPTRYKQPAFSETTASSPDSILKPSATSSPLETPSRQTSPSKKERLRHFPCKSSPSTYPVAGTHTSVETGHRESSSNSNSNQRANARTRTLLSSLGGSNKPSNLPLPRRRNSQKSKRKSNMSKSPSSHHQRLGTRSPSRRRSISQHSARHNPRSTAINPTDHKPRMAFDSKDEKAYPSKTRPSPGASNIHGPRTRSLDSTRVSDPNRNRYKEKHEKKSLQRRRSSKVPTSSSPLPRRRDAKASTRQPLRQSPSISPPSRRVSSSSSPSPAALPGRRPERKTSPNYVNQKVQAVPKSAPPALTRRKSSTWDDIQFPEAPFDEDDFANDTAARNTGPWIPPPPPPPPPSLTPSPRRSGHGSRGIHSNSSQKRFRKSVLKTPASSPANGRPRSRRSELVEPPIEVVFTNSGGNNLDVENPSLDRRGEVLLRKYEKENHPPPLSFQKPDKKRFMQHGNDRIKADEEEPSIFSWLWKLGLCLLCLVLVGTAVAVGVLLGMPDKSNETGSQGDRPPSTDDTVSSGNESNAVPPSRGTAKASKYRCFETSAELKNSVNSWFDEDPGVVEDEFGPMPDWCFTSGVKDLSWLFRDRFQFNENIGKWDVSNIEKMNGLFWGARAFNQNLEMWDVSNVEEMSHLCGFCQEFNATHAFSKWDVSNVRCMDGMFRSARIVQPFDLSSWNVSQVVNMSWAFAGGENADPNIGGWDVSQVQDMSNLFAFNPNFNGDITGWNVSSVKKMNGMFRSATSFDQDLSGWNVVNVYDASGMFFGATSFRQNLCGWGLKMPESQVTVQNMFLSADSCESQESPTLLGLDTSPDDHRVGPFCQFCNDPHGNTIL